VERIVGAQFAFVIFLQSMPFSLLALVWILTRLGMLS